jgi:hypothetical protein
MMNSLELILPFNFSIMNNYFVCKNGQNISWTSVCDGHNQCIDGSDERNCNYILIVFFL